MLQVLPQASFKTLPEQNVQFDELGDLKSAVKPFTKLIDRSGQSVVLHCAVPTWSLSSDTCLDLHDLNELRSRFLHFIHDVIEELRSRQISASYRLVPSNSSLCLVCALPPDLNSPEIKTMAFDVLSNSKKLCKRKNVLLADLEHGPALIIT